MRVPTVQSGSGYDAEGSDAARSQNLTTLAALVMMGISLGSMMMKDSRSKRVPRLGVHQPPHQRDLQGNLFSKKLFDSKMALLGKKEAAWGLGTLELLPS